MAPRGTRFSFGNASGLVKKRWLGIERFIGAAATTVLSGAGAGGPVTVAAIGESGKTIGITVLGLGADADEYATFEPNLWDVDLTQPIYLDLYVFFNSAMTAGEGCTWQGTVIDWDPERATADGISDDEDTITLAGSCSKVYAATDGMNIKKLTGLSIAANSITSNEHGMVLILTGTIDGAASPDEMGLAGVMLRYTAK